MMQTQNSKTLSPNLSRPPGDLVPTADVHAAAAIDCVDLACARPCWLCPDRAHENKRDVIDSGDRLIAREVAA